MDFRIIQRALVLLLITTGMVGAAGKPATATDQRAAVQSTLVEFYRWYVGAVAKMDDPLRDNRRKMETYVSKQLLQEIIRREKSGDVDADYFTESQDILDDWPDHIAISHLNVGDTGATAMVTLGASEASKQWLAVVLVREEGAWKIRRVNPFRLSGL